jgi:hypothetical protein
MPTPSRSNLSRQRKKRLEALAEKSVTVRVSCLIADDAPIQKARICGERNLRSLLVHIESNSEETLDQAVDTSRRVAGSIPKNIGVWRL